MVLANGIYRSRSSNFIFTAEEVKVKTTTKRAVRQGIGPEKPFLAMRIARVYPMRSCVATRMVSTFLVERMNAIDVAIDWVPGINAGVTVPEGLRVVLPEVEVMNIFRLRMEVSMTSSREAWLLLIYPSRTHCSSAPSSSPPRGIDLRRREHDHRLRISPH